jgi:hypothetical protein
MPELAKVAQELSVDLRRVKKEDLMLLVLIGNHNQVLEILSNQTKILNDLHQLLVKLSEDTAVLLKRTELAKT